MVKPIEAILYFYVWVNGSWSVELSNKVYHEPTHCQVTVNDLITNENIYDLNKTLESVLIKKD